MAIFGDDGGEKLLDFIRGCIIPHEQSFCFYLRKGVRHFETTTSEGAICLVFFRCLQLSLNGNRSIGPYMFRVNNKQI